MSKAVQQFAAGFSEIAAVGIPDAIGSTVAMQSKTLEMISNGAAISDVLNELCRSVDAHTPNATTLFLLKDSDGSCLWPAAGPRLRPAWKAALSPLRIGPRDGSCGTAAYRKERVIVSDVAVDPVWPDEYRSFAIANGILASWSQPLISSNGEVLGTFSMCYPEPRSPDDKDLALIEEVGHIARLAIEHDRSQSALNKALERLNQSEAQLRRIIDAIPQHIVVLSPEGTALDANKSMLDYTGLTIDDVRSPGFRPRIFYPDDLERFKQEYSQAFTRELPFQHELRVRSTDGQYRWALLRYNPLRNEEGRVIRWYATGTDIHERKEAEERTRNETFALREEIDHSSMFEEILGSSQAIRQVLTQVTKVARTDSTVLILGETGTGKELIARAIHRQSRRSRQAFIRVNCAAIPPALISSELFGHEKGAFTGALQRRIGRFESADGGTIFLDEIGDLPPEVQVALLRVLQEREFERVGSSKPISVNVRVVAATNRNLIAAITAGTFREDLFYRLNVFPIHLPALRERASDIPLLADYLVGRYGKREGKTIRHIARQTIELFQAYRWPGNVRELQNIIERAVILCESGILAVESNWLRQDLPAWVPHGSGLLNPDREKIEAALAACHGVVAGPQGAAARLGLPRQTLDSKIACLRIEKHRFRTR